MPKYRAWGTVTGGKYLGEYEAESEEEAMDMASENAYVSICHQCSGEIDDPEITDISVEVIQ